MGGSECLHAYAGAITVVAFISRPVAIDQCVIRSWMSRGIETGVLPAGTARQIISSSPDAVVPCPRAPPPETCRLHVSSIEDAHGPECFDRLRHNLRNSMRRRFGVAVLALCST